MSLSDETRHAIHDYLYKVVSEFVIKSLKGIGEKPFHERLLPVLSQTKFSERGFSTSSGSWFQNIALMIARQYHQRANLNYLVRGEIQPAAEAHIAAILEQMDHGTPKRRPNREQDTREVLIVQFAGGTHREVRSDLFVLSSTGTEMYFEMKTPGPNKGQCKTMKRDMLLITALRYEQKAEAYAAAAYNPFGDGKPYRHGYALQFLEVGCEFLVGRPFWTKIGEPSTYDELLEIAEAVGNRIKPLTENG